MDERTKGRWTLRLLRQAQNKSLYSLRAGERTKGRGENLSSFFLVRPAGISHCERLFVAWQSTKDKDFRVLFDGAKRDGEGNAILSIRASFASTNVEAYNVRITGPFFTHISTISHVMITCYGGG